MSDTHPHNIHRKLHLAMGEIGRVNKGLTVEAGRNSYRAVSHDDVVAAVRPAFLKHGITCLLSIADAKEESYQVVRKSGQTVTEYRVTVWVDVTFTSVHDGSSVTVRGYAVGVDSGDKGPGKAISYAKKYALLTCLLLSTGEDVDMHASEEGLRSSTQLEQAKHAAQHAAEVRLVKADRTIAELAGEAIAGELRANVQALGMTPDVALARYLKVHQACQHASQRLSADEMTQAMDGYCEEHHDSGTPYDLFERIATDLPAKVQQTNDGAGNDQQEKKEW
jgi:hypothetical protein